VEQGDGPKAVSILSEVVIQLRKSPVRSGEARCLAFLSEAQLLAGDRDLAQETASRALEVSQSDGFKFSSGLALRALGRIAIARQNFGEAELRLTGALTTFTECGAAFEAARTQADLAALFAGKRERKAARDYLAAALTGFKQARAPKRVAEARRPHTRNRLGPNSVTRSPAACAAGTICIPERAWSPILEQCISLIEYPRQFRLCAAVFHRLQRKMVRKPPRGKRAVPG
jgi:tetratricopeptide (TPR) repeat protein